MGRLRSAVVSAAVLAPLALASSASAGDAGPRVLTPTFAGTSPPASELPDRAHDGTTTVPRRVNPLDGASADGSGADARGRDPLARSGASATRTPSPTDTFDGTGNPTACGTCAPPDPIGDVGPNHYIQMVNATKVAVFNKSGAPLIPLFDLGELWPAADECADNAGDPVVLYDPLANRWLLSQFYEGPDPDTGGLCFAISTSPDPTGSYHVYTFDTGFFPDYFKVGVMPDGYYVSDNETPGYSAYAFDRTKMLAGDPSAGGVGFTGETNLLLPADVDGPRPPTTPGGLFYTFKDSAFHGVPQDRIELFRLTPNFANPPASTFTGPQAIPVAGFNYTVCGFFVLNCIPQGGTAQKVDAVSEWPMWRFAYRRFPDGRESLVGNFTIRSHTPSVTTAGAGIRWFELRNTGSGFSLFQQGTLDPNDGMDRFMGSISMDWQGNIALAYSASNGTTFPSVRYATRLVSDPPGTLGAEQILQAGGGSQTGSNRWGDYSATSTDPVDNCTFWHTNEYYSLPGVTTWRTVIGNFKEPGCTANRDGDAVPDASDACPDLFGTGPDGCPDNDISFGKPKLNKKKGTATLPVKVPGPGELTMAGKNLKPVNRSRAGARPVAGAGTEKLKIKPKGRAKRRLKKQGKAKVKPKVTFTPTGGTANTESTKVKLKRKLKNR